VKFYKESTGGRKEATDLENAVAHAVHMAGYSCDGALERAQAHADKTAEMFGRLLHELVEAGVLRQAEQISRILETGYVDVED